jgi:hypothetical protein
MESAPVHHGPLISAAVITAILALFIIGTLFFLAIVRAVDAESPTSQTMNVLYVLALAAFLPSWGSFILVFVNSFNSSSHSFWSVALWTVLFATYRFGTAFLAAAFVAGLVYFVTRSDHLVRLKRMLVTLAITGAIAVGYSLWLYSRPFHGGE